MTFSWLVPLEFRSFLFCIDSVCDNSNVAHSLLTGDHLTLCHRCDQEDQLTCFKHQQLPCFSWHTSGCRFLKTSCASSFFPSSRAHAIVETSALSKVTVSLEIVWGLPENAHHSWSKNKFHESCTLLINDACREYPSKHHICADCLCTRNVHQIFVTSHT